MERRQRNPSVDGVFLHRFKKRRQSEVNGSVSSMIQLPVLVCTAKEQSCFLNSNHWEVLLCATISDNLKLIRCDRQDPAHYWDTDFEIHNGRYVVNLVSLKASECGFLSAAEDGSLGLSTNVEDVVRKANGLLESEIQYTLSTRYFRGHHSYVISCDCSPSDQLLVSTGLDRTVRLWDPRCNNRSEEVMRIELSSDANAMSIQFFPRIGPDESVHLLASHQDNSVRIWDMRNGMAETTLTATDTNASTQNFGTPSQMVDTRPSSPPAANSIWSSSFSGSWGSWSGGWLSNSQESIGEPSSTSTSSESDQESERCLMKLNTVEKESSILAENFDVFTKSYEPNTRLHKDRLNWAHILDASGRFILTSSGSEHLTWDLMDGRPVRRYLRKTGHGCTSHPAKELPQIIPHLGDPRRGPWLLQPGTCGNAQIWCIDPKLPRFFTSRGEYNPSVAVESTECCGVSSVTSNDMFPLCEVQTPSQCSLTMAVMSPLSYTLFLNDVSGCLWRGCPFE